MQEEILVVDDERVIRELCQHILSAAGYRCYTAEDAAEAKAMLAQYPISLVLSDLTMPGESGMDLLHYTQTHWPSIATVIVTGSSDIPTALEAVRHGACDYISKPFRTAELPLKIGIALEKRRLELENREHHSRLESKVAEQTQEIRQLYQREQQRATELEKALQEVKQAHLQAQEALIAALGLRDCETRGHCRRVMLYASLLARTLRLSHEEILYLERGALLHDIGKIGIPDAVLLKPGPLNETEWALMRKHPLQGASMIADIQFLQPASSVILYHHEHYDGTGYPYGLKGKNIPVSARVFAVVDALDAITSKRPYKEALSFEEAHREIQKCSSSHFDPDIVSAFLTVPLREWEQLKQQVDSEIDTLAIEELLELGDESTDASSSSPGQKYLWG